MRLFSPYHAHIGMQRRAFAWYGTGMFAPRPQPIPLDETAVSVEITLISIIEGFALAALAASILPADGLPFEYIPYAAAGLVFILVFWSQSVLHTVSFIRWPLSPSHMLLYFVAALSQVVAYGHLTDPAEWFLWWFFFAIIGGILYIVDLGIIRRERPAFARLPNGEAFIDIVEKRHIYEMRTIVIAALIFNGGAYALFAFNPSFAASSNIVFIVGLVQLVPSLFTLVDSVRNFSRRARLISGLYPNS